MSEPSAYEQYALELINAQRLNPQGAADAYGASSGTITAAQLQPLAFNLLLNDAVEDHSQWILQTNRFSHTGQGGSTPEDRMIAAGYQFTGDSASEENLAMSLTTGFLNWRRYSRIERERTFTWRRPDSTRRRSQRGYGCAENECKPIDRLERRPATSQ